MSVLGLVLVNVILILLRLFDDTVDEERVEGLADQQNKPLPVVEQIENTPPGNPDSEAEAREEPTEEPLDVPEGHACVRVGPFASEKEQSNMQSELMELFSRVLVRETKSIEDDGYWVYLPPYPARTEAEQAVEKLKAAEVSDYYLVRDGQHVNAVSLGIYDRREPAEERRRQVLDSVPGLDIVVELRTRIASQYWLEAGPVDALNPALIQLSITHPDVEHLQIACPDELTEKNK